MIEHGETSEVRLANRLIVRRGVIIVSFWIVLAAATAVAQQSLGTVTGTVITRRDLNGRDTLAEKVVTHHARTNGEGRDVIETYRTSMEAGRLALTQRVNRVTPPRRTGVRPSKKPKNPAAFHLAIRCESSEEA